MADLDSIQERVVCAIHGLLLPDLIVTPDDVDNALSVAFKGTDDYYGIRFRLQQHLIYTVGSEETSVNNILAHIDEFFEMARYQRRSGRI